MRHFLEGMVLGFGFFSQIRIPYTVKDLTPSHYAYMALSLPLVGGVLGGIVVAVFELLAHRVDTLYGAIVAALLYPVLYGFLHIEAVVDIVDGYFAKHGGKSVYEVLKEPTIGALGAMSGMVVVLLKSVAMVWLLKKGALEEVVVALLLSRLGVVWVIFFGHFHPKSSLLLKMQKGLNPIWFIGVNVLVLVWLSLFGGWYLFFVLLGLGYFLYRWVMVQIGFVNGDGVGFMLEMEELFLLHLLVVI